MPDRLHYCSIDIGWIEKLTSFFERIKKKGEDKYFHPHSFDKKQVEQLGDYKGNDLYFLQTYENAICGYGMLRGWDEGYRVPSLGIIIHPDHRGKGLGEKFMVFLHNQAKQKGAKQICLKAYPGNKSAISLYKKMGYLFDGEKEGQLSGYIKL